MLSLVNNCNENERTLDTAMRIINILLKQDVPCNYLCKYYKDWYKSSTACPGLKYGRNKCAEAVLISCREDPEILRRLESPGVTLRTC